mmetsp:Transcript_46034/g.146980  ORF Transcript_46034/g.146980 Transcript_46034/m.146980 type:complete len:177 (+) Transcript_46034:90-620(+)|eukprot:CAMPEP_0204171418 /NCGR_PEP_ID=MMETSP0361-20130328/43220_1 /ASSEMBLY_ACC=CAM_ASM_000343 /TAXON_ID=268821 /ORGANISM="Scrippsiella Hangoei, Strain SHTV-5" /LENGTH=176 /DNA_ID=CAMNT_0051129319 /DNA_START=62 /DNA_END=592 /DNA_ORIENTATION=+
MTKQSSGGARPFRVAGVPSEGLEASMKLVDNDDRPTLRPDSDEIAHFDEGRSHTAPVRCDHHRKPQMHFAFDDNTDQRSGRDELTSDTIDELFAEVDRLSAGPGSLTQEPYFVNTAFQDCDLRAQVPQPRVQPFDMGPDNTLWNDIDRVVLCERDEVSKKDIIEVFKYSDSLLREA